MTYRFTALSPRRHELGEGARTHDDGFVFVDLLAGALYATNGAASPRQLLDLEVPLGAVAPTTGGGWIAAAGTGFAHIRDEVRWIARPEGDASLPMRMNDAALDPHGRFWACSMAYDATPGTGSLYRLDPDLKVHKVLDGLTVPNGPVFDATGRTMYLAESSLGTIYRCEVDVESGIPGPLNVFAQVDDASPDGMALDAQGFLWSAVWGGARLHRYSPSGSLDRVVAVPARQPTSLAFHGSHLLVTTAIHGLLEPADHDGRTLIAALPRGVRGLGTEWYFSDPIQHLADDEGLSQRCMSAAGGRDAASRNASTVERGACVAARSAP